MQKYVYKGGVGWWSRGWYTWAFEKRTFNVDGLGGIVDVARAIAMSRWPPEIAGTISHPAGRSAVTAERVPIFYSARSSSPSFHPHALSLSLLFRCPTPLYFSSTTLYAQGSRCVGPIQRLDENGPEPFPPRKRRTKGVAEDGRKHERKQMPRQHPTYLRYPLSCPSFSRFALVLLFPRPLLSHTRPPSFLSSNISVRGRGGCELKARQR